MNTRKAVIVIISIIGLSASLYIIANGLSNMQHASQEVIDSCKALKNATINEKVALEGLPSAYRTPADIEHYTNAVNSYNEQCGKDTGLLTN